jgi:tryptophan synthase alpha chain
MELCKRVSSRLPVLPMVYANVILTLGAERFAAALEGAGAAGAIVPDLPRSEDPSVADALLARGLAPIGFISPTTSPERLAQISADAVGFTYVVSLAGVTGERKELPPELGAMVEAVKAASDAPAAVGFGIGTPEQAAQVGEVADGVIIGTRLVRAVADAADGPAAVDAVSAFMADTRLAL